MYWMRDEAWWNKYGELVILSMASQSSVIPWATYGADRRTMPQVLLNYWPDWSSLYKR